MTKQTMKKSDKTILLALYVLTSILLVFNVFNLSLNTNLTFTFTNLLLIILIPIISVLTYNLKKTSIAYEFLFLNIVAIIFNILGVSCELNFMITLSLLLSFSVVYIAVLNYFLIKSKLILNILIAILILIFSIFIGVLSELSFKAFKYNNQTYINTQKETPDNISQYFNNISNSPSLLNIYNGTMSIQLSNLGDKTILQAQEDTLEQVCDILKDLTKQFPRVKHYVFYATSTPYFTGNIISISIDMNTVSSNTLKNLDTLNNLNELKNVKGIEFYSVPLDTKPLVQPKAKKVIPPSTSTPVKTSENDANTDNTTTTAQSNNDDDDNSSNTKTNNNVTSTSDTDDTTSDDTTSSNSSDTDDSTDNTTTSTSNQTTASQSVKSYHHSSGNYYDDSNDDSSSKSASINKEYESEDAGEGYGIIKQLGSGYYQVRLHSRPSSSSSYSEDLSGGTRVKIINEDSYDYYYVKAPDGDYGYVFYRYITQS